MGIHDYLRFFFALAFVLALMGIVAQLARRSGFGAGITRMGAGKRLAVLEVRSIDPRHKLVLVKCDDREHLLVLSPEGQKVIESNITTPKAAA